jgi:hypothetical protein
MKNLFFFNIILVIIISCTTEKYISKSNKTINLDSLGKIESIKFTDYFKSYKIIPLETNDNCIIGLISQMKIFEDSIYILEGYTNKIIVFNKYGDFVRKFGEIGKGPGEFISPSSFTINKKEREILILDSQFPKVIRYSLDGKYKDEFRLPKNILPYSIAVLNDNIYVDVLTNKNYKNDYLVYQIDSTGKEIKNWLKVPKENKGFELPMAINMGGRFYESESDIKFFHELLPEIFSISGNDNVDPFITLYSNNLVSNEDWNQIHSQYKESDRQKAILMVNSIGKIWGVGNYIENPELAIFNFNENREHINLFYNIKSNQIRYSNKVIDDLTLLNIYFPFFQAVSNGSFIRVILPRQIDDLKQLVNEKKLIVNDNEKAKIEKLTQQSNPLLIYYETK